MKDDNRGEPEATATKRARLRRKVGESEAAMARSPLPERDPPDGYTALAMDYPFALVLGGLALGAVAGALLPRSAGGRLVRGAIAVAGVAGELGLAYGRHALESASEMSSDGRQRIGALGGKAASVATQAASEAGTAATKAIGTAGEAAGEIAGNARDTGLKIARQVIRLTSHLRH
ncbi:hypothetical protein ACFOD9_08860 [Novosphingobium bradum]|uniref:Uncharacterized protein n=1 Tax=Novosphingobium bradum TaxID=1737444 RepID=A0ABV7INW3_9SPHN